MGDLRWETDDSVESEKCRFTQSALEGCLEIIWFPAAQIVLCGPAAARHLGACEKRLSPDLLNPNLHFHKLPGGSLAHESMRNTTLVFSLALS